MDRHEVTVEAAGGDLAQAFGDTDGDGRRPYWISEIGPGDTCRIPSVAWYTR